MTNDPTMPESGWAAPRAKLAAAVLTTLAVLSVLLGGTGAASPHRTAPVAAQTSIDIRPMACAVTDKARQTLNLVDSGRWPPRDGSGTKGGTTWTDREGTLPRDDNGRAVHYREWDVNPKVPGHNRDADRIVTGDDGSAWYTGDHYATFCRMR